MLGFAALRDLVGRATVGECVEDQHATAEGTAEQRTTRGLLVWQRAENRTAFTDGYRTWLNGPFGLQQRLNTARLPWEPRRAPAGAARSSAAAGGAPPPTLDDFWEGRAAWYVDVADVRLPLGESDTLLGPDGALWSYLHASARSTGVVDNWGTPAPFPGCVTLWKSVDGGRSFVLPVPECLIPCRASPCDALVDHVYQQQYPRVARHASGAFLMVYEWRARPLLRVSPDGVAWSPPLALEAEETGHWLPERRPCGPAEGIGPHPFDGVITAGDWTDEGHCFAGGPPGLAIEGDAVYVFVGLGKKPGALGCYVGSVAALLSPPRPPPPTSPIGQAAGMRRCLTEPLFRGAPAYGPLAVSGPEANPFFDFYIVSSADVLRVGDRHYMVYEGARGPSAEGTGIDQFGLGLARSTGPRLDGPWEKYVETPILADLPGNIGIGHADLLVLDGTTYLYTATSHTTRGRYVLDWGAS